MLLLVWEIMAYGRQPYSGTEIKEVMKAVVGGRRLVRPPDCPEHVWDVIYSCWIREPNRRPSFRQLTKLFKTMMSEHEAEEIRDIGALLNKDLTENIKQLTLSRKKGKTGE